MAGLLPPGADRARHLDCYVQAIGRAADRLAAVGATVLLEPINTRVDVPGYLLDSTALASARNTTSGSRTARSAAKSPL